jgi:hypothetical protein
MFECRKCGKCFEYESDYTKHLAMSTDCSQNLSMDISNNQCHLCHKVFVSKSSLTRHIKNVGNKCQQWVDFQSIKEQFKKELKTEILDELKKNKLLSITNNVINSSVSNTNNYLFAKPGDECMKHITKEVILELLNKKFENICVTLMQEAYFNRRVPKNHNWCLAYPNNDKAAVVFNYDKNEFVRESTEETINKKFSNLLELLTPVLLEIIDEENETGFLNKTQRANLIRLQYFAHVEKLSDEAKALHDDIRKIAHDNRKIPMKTWDDAGFKGNHLSLKFH